MPFNARREVLIIGFAHHSLLKLDESGRTQISLSRPWQANQRKKRQVLSTIQALSPMPFNARREAQLVKFAYPYLLKLDKEGQNWKKRTASDHTAPQQSLTASRGLWHISAPSRLGLQFAQSHHHSGAQRPGQI